MSEENKPGPASEESPTDAVADEAESKSKKKAATGRPTAKKRSSGASSTGKKKPAVTVKTKAVGKRGSGAGAKAADKPQSAESAAQKSASSEPLPEDEPTGGDLAAKAEEPSAATPEEQPRTEPPPVPPHYRSRHPQPSPSPSGGGGRVTMLVVAVFALVFVILSLANSRSYQILEEDGQAVLSKGYFLPAGAHSIIPDGAATAFAPIPWITPPQGSVTRGNLREVCATYYALLYLEAGEAMEDDGAFDQYDQQAAGLEAWYHDRFGVYPEATDKMHDLRFRVRNRRSATKEYIERRDGVLQQIEELIGTAPERTSPAVLEDVARFEAFLEQERATTF